MKTIDKYKATISDLWKSDRGQSEDYTNVVRIPEDSVLYHADFEGTTVFTLLNPIGPDASDEVSKYGSDKLRFPAGRLFKVVSWSNFHSEQEPLDTRETITIRRIETDRKKGKLNIIEYATHKSKWTTKDLTEVGRACFDIEQQEDGGMLSKTEEAMLRAAQ